MFERKEIVAGRLGRVGISSLTAPSDMYLAETESLELSGTMEEAEQSKQVRRRSHLG